MTQLEPHADPRVALDAFDRNGRVNAATLDDLDDTLLAFSDDPGGFRIGQHFADMLSLRFDKLRQVAPAFAASLIDPTDADHPTWLRARTIAELRADFDRWDAALRSAVEAHVADQRSFEPMYRSHPAALLIHCIVHDAHHRGQIAALVRRSGRVAERREALEDQTWAIWRE